MKEVFIPNDKGAFVIEENGERVAEMIVGISGKEMSVYHTEVVESMEGKGIGKQLIDVMVDYARENQLEIIPICPFVKTMFKRSPEKYGELWKDFERG